MHSSRHTARALVLGMMLVAILACGGRPPAEISEPKFGIDHLDYSESVPWQDFSEERLQSLRGTPVLVFITADWSMAAKVDEKITMASEEVRKAMESHGVVPLEADYTQRDPALSAWMETLQIVNVPHVVLVSRTGQTTVLPSVTPETLVTAMEALSNAP